MDPRVLAGVLAVLGLLLILASPAMIVGYAVGDVLVGLGVVYLITGLGIASLSIGRGRDRVSFPIAVATSLVCVVAVLVTLIEDLGPSGIEFTPLSPSWWAITIGATPAVTVPLVAALVFPLALMETADDRRIALGLLAIPPTVGVISFVANPAGFGVAFGVVLVGALVLAGGIAGIPLYVFGQALRANGDLKRVIRSHLDLGSTP